MPIVAHNTNKKTTYLLVSLYRYWSKTRSSTQFCRMFVDGHLPDDCFWPNPALGSE
jgi:hypothetical protein